MVPRNLLVSGLRALGDPDTRLYVTAHLLLSVASQGLEPPRFGLTAIYCVPELFNFSESQFSHLKTEIIITAGIYCMLTKCHFKTNTATLTTSQ